MHTYSSDAAVSAEVTSSGDIDLDTQYAMLSSGTTTTTVDSSDPDAVIADVIKKKREKFNEHDPCR